MKYIIHTCKQRLWYVTKYLVPSMTEQGISFDSIAVYVDTKEEGCLESCMKLFQSMPKDGYTWHLQDDVIISSDFVEHTRAYNNYDGIVCGYCYDLDARKEYLGEVKQHQMWFSFPCIKIPNRIARECGKWYFSKAKKDPEYRMWVRAKKYDDAFFYIFLETYYPDIKVLNLYPNIVDHIDYLIGGSVINSIRTEKETHAVYFADTYLIEELEQKLNNS